MKVRKAVIPAAGLGTRFLPATKAQPKEMLPIVDKPTIQFIIEEAVDSGIEEILIITGRNKASIENHFDRSVELELELQRSGKLDALEEVRRISNMANICYVRQKEPLGLGHAIYCAKSFIGNEPFAVLLGDDIVFSDKPCLKQMIEIYDEYASSVLGVQNVPQKDVEKYGIIDGTHLGNGVYRVHDLCEKPSVEKAPSTIAILGRYIITPDIFDIIEDTRPGKNGEIQLTDALTVLSKRRAMYAYDFVGRRYDAGDKRGFVEAIVEYALSREDLRRDFLPYLVNLVERETEKTPTLVGAE